jgi:preprotein translocase subunit SecB
MELAPLQLIRYWIDDLEIHANRQFDAEKEEGHYLDSLDVNSNVRELDPPEGATGDLGLFWLISLSIKVGDEAKDTDPYGIHLNLSGILQSSPKVAADNVRRLVEVNGPSMLFGVAREIVRNLTASGPFPAVLFPSVSFLGKVEETK